MQSAGTATLLWGVLFGAIGLGFFTYGTKQRAAVPLLAGVALFVIPYLISNAFLLVLAGVVIIAVPYFVRI
jgi:predicted membrane protein